MDAAEAWSRAARNKFQRWNYDPARFEQAPLPVAHQPKFQLKASDRFFCIGSCFARNIEEHLIYSRIEVLSKRVFSPIEEWANRPNAFMNKYTLASMLNELRWAIDPPEDIPPELFFETDAGWLDPQLSPAANPTRFERVVERRRYLSDEVFSRIRQADVVVVTLGLVEAWFDNLTGLWLNGSPPHKTIRAEPGRFSFTATSVTQNSDWLEQVYRAIKALNPAARIVATVSPVPMDTTFSGKDSAVAHVLSKARLRVVADLFVERHEDADYFPSFEMISLAPHALAFSDDHIHPEDAAVGGVVRAFVKTFIPDAPEAVSGYHEMTYLRANPEIYAAVRRGELTSGFEHWITTQPELQNVG
jgi:hypothetical protein